MKFQNFRLLIGDRNNTSDPIAGLCEGESFNDLLRVERKRTERSRRPFLLVLIGLEHFHPHEKEKAAKQITATLFSKSRETDVKGWYKRDSVIGIIFTDLNLDNSMTCFQDMILDKVCGGIKSVIGSDRFGRLEINLHVFPQDPLEVSSGIYIGALLSGRAAMSS